MIKGVVGPHNRIVTGGAVGRSESRARSRVRRVVCVVPVGQMAAGISAVGRRDRQGVVVVDMALTAGRNIAGRCQMVRVGQRETRGAVIKRRVGPVRRVVAAGAL